MCTCVGRRVPVCVFVYRLEKRVEAGDSTGKTNAVARSGAGVGVRMDESRALLLWPCTPLPSREWLHPQGLFLDSPSFNSLLALLLTKFCELEPVT